MTSPIAVSFFNLLVALFSFATAASIGAGISYFLLSFHEREFVIDPIRVPKDSEPEARSSSPTQPPVYAELLLALCTSSDHREAVLGDAEERFRRQIGLFGKSRALRLYWIEALESAWPLLWSKLKKYGIVAAVVSAAWKVIRNP